MIIDLSRPIPLDFEVFGNFGIGALLTIKFECAKCRQSVIVDVEAPEYTVGAPVWGEVTEVECDCGAEYSLAIYGESGCWGLELERTDESFTILARKLMTYQFRVKEYYCDPDYHDLWEDEEEQANPR